MLRLTKVTWNYIVNKLKSNILFLFLMKQKAADLMRLMASSFKNLFKTYIKLFKNCNLNIKFNCQSQFIILTWIAKCNHIHRTLNVNSGHALCNSFFQILQEAITEKIIEPLVGDFLLKMRLLVHFIHIMVHS